MKLFLHPSATAYCPGDWVTALVIASSETPEPQLVELDVEFAGVERVDTSWVTPMYRSSVPAINSDKRRIQRHIVQGRLQAASQGDFSESLIRKFVLRFKLPDWLPPTYGGTSARFQYSLATRLVIHGTEQPPMTQVPLQIWPATQKKIVNSTTENEVLIKCWEVGTGTAVHDAISHIADLVTESCTSRPSSPGRKPFPSFEEVKERDKSHQLMHAPQEEAYLGTESEAFFGRNYNLRIGERRLVTVAVYPPPGEGLHPGSTVGGTLSFHKHHSRSPDGEDMQCMKVQILLETEETVEPEWQAKTSGVIRKVHDEHFEITWDMTSTSFLFSIPEQGPANFSTSLVTVRWLLRFTFTAQANEGQLEDLTWTLPLPVLPYHVAGSS